jgi:prepilin-type N-terminal cleavage/methylation domain-containing protein
MNIMNTMNTMNTSNAAASSVTGSPRRRCAARGFSLIELLLAIFILGVGVISISAVFPAGIVQQRRAQDDVLGPVIAEAAMSSIRSKVRQSDFGTFEEFGIYTPATFAPLDGDFPNTWLRGGDEFTQRGDWPWLRPSMAVVPAGVAADSREYFGDIDIFSARVARDSLFAPEYPAGANLDWQIGKTTELRLSNGFPVLGTYPADLGGFLFGIPFNRSKFDFFGVSEDPLVTITQEERFWPSGTGYETGRNRPQYAWDCMFRRFQGRVQVAIFVYRVKVGAAAGGYAVAQDAGNNAYDRDGLRPAMPARADFFMSVAGSSYRPLTPYGADPTPGGPPDLDDFDRVEIIGTGPQFNEPNPTLDPYFEGWQAPGQWLLDPSNRIHRVAQGRRNKRQGPVRLARPIPSQAPSSAIWNPATAEGGPYSDPAEIQSETDEVRSLWFVPPVDRRGVSLTPIYITVRDL